MLQQPDITRACVSLLAIRPIHPFPARMAPSIAFEELPYSEKPLRVLDPMVGSGTTAVVARAKGHHAIGFDSDPLAVALSSTWCADCREDDIKDLAQDVLDEAGPRYRKLRAADGYPAGADDDTKAFIRYWFDRRNRLQLRALADAIQGVTKRIDRTVLWCGFSRLIIAKSRGVSLAMDLSHSRPHKVFEKAPIGPFDEFLAAVDRVLRNMPFKDGSDSLPQAEIRRHDARRLPLADGSIDFVITSPPYLNAIDYVRCSKFTLVWMGHAVSDLQELRSDNIGSERSSEKSGTAEDIAGIIESIDVGDLGPRHKGMLTRYIEDLDLVLKEIARVLVRAGRAVIVVGDSTLRGVFVRNSEIVRLLGSKSGLNFVKSAARDLLPSRRYLPPPDRSGGSSELAERMRQEVIIHFTRE